MTESGDRNDVTSNGEPPRTMTPTLEQVAATAGVSRGTVSRVINDSPQVSPKAREAVRAAVAELGYVPNRAARGLVTRRSDSVALAISESETRVFAEPFFGGIVRGISRALSEADIQLVLMLAQTAREHTRVERYARSGHVDGVLLISLHGDDPLPRSLAASHVPVVVLGRPTSALTGVPYVDADNVSGTRTATQFLLGHGRNTVATVAGPQDMTVGIDRLEGYREALRAHRRPAHDLVELGDFSQRSGELAMQRLLTRQPDIDAVLAASDPMAAGALRAIRETGRRVPEDIALIGFDDSETATNTDPPLTTVRQPLDAMGREMTRLLLTQIDGKTPEETSVVLPTELIVRAST